MAGWYDVQDMILAILKDDVKNKIVDLNPTLLRDYVGVNRLFRKSTYVQQSGGLHEWFANVTGAEAAEPFGPYAVFTRGRSDHLKKASVGLRGYQNSYSFDIHEEVFNRGGATLVNHVRNVKQQAVIAHTATIETRLWSNATYAQRDLHMQGLLYWLPYTAAAVAGTPNFVGTYPTDYTDIAGIDPDDYTGWKSYGDIYVAPTVDDLVDKITLGMSETRFMSPITPMEVADLTSGYMFGLYMGLDTQRALDREAKKQNDSIGADLDAYHGKAMIRQTPIVEVPALRSNTRRPVFGVNWGVTKLHVLDKNWFKHIPAPKKSDQPFVVTNDIVSIPNLIMYNRRTGGFNISLAA